MASQPHDTAKPRFSGYRTHLSRPRPTALFSKGWFLANAVFALYLGISIVAYPFIKLERALRRRQDD